MTSSSERNINQKIVEQAIDYLLSEADESIVTAWRKQDPDHDLAWQRLLLINGEFDSLKNTAVSSQSLHHVDHSRRNIIACLALLGLCTTGYINWRNNQAKKISTQLAEQLKFDNEIGLFTLNASSRIEFNPSDDSLPVISVDSGDFIFTAKQDCWLHLNDCQLKIKANTKVWANNILFMLISGNAFHPKLGNITEHNQVLHGTDTSLTNASLPYHPLAWLDGKLIANNMPLSIFFDYFSRYHNAWFQLSNKAKLSYISGVFDLYDLIKALDAIAASLSLPYRSVAHFYFKIG